MLQLHIRLVAGTIHGKQLIVFCLYHVGEQYSRAEGPAGRAGEDDKDARTV